MKRFLNSTLIFCTLMIISAVMVVADTPYYTYGSGTYGVETDAESVAAAAAVPAYRMPSEPMTETISSAAVLLLQDFVGSYEPKFAIISANDNFYLNGSVATPTLGFFCAKDVWHLVPLGDSVSVVTSSDTLGLKILPIK